MWGRAQCEAARRCKSDWGDSLGGCILPHAVHCIGQKIMSAHLKNFVFSPSKCCILMHS